MQIQDVFSHYGPELKRVEEEMESHLRSDVTVIPEIVNHLLGSGGKRFRPLLVLTTADLFGYQGKRCYTLSAVIEFIHTASLFHDDVIDKAETRRGKVSANNIWGNAATVLVGDYLYSKAYQLMAEDGNLKIVQLISNTSNVMSEGEVFQLIKCGEVNLSEEEYRKIIEKKTSILISASCALGGHLGNAGADRIEALKQFGLRLGSAFQITDDTLDYVAREDEFGKAIGKDLGEGKMTLPLIYTLKRCTPDEREFIEGALASRQTREIPVEEILTLISRYGGIADALRSAEILIEEGRAFLDGMPETPAKEALLAICDYVLKRNL
ncbi:octaprenyl-diphosphate synthase [Syntrophus gentianae]|uniref:Octaprenyl-diphosphate synthase n=1 Tax=Syntrophus gentianae TaxID=43775 RepID=A0A1H7UVH0_9BACT|nr:polyprenyl synthetase family protein [Syntrophus gentianae]SEM00685.1 octaprenyl-diphosphate synthase [Syntrophus gentianae]